MRVVIGAACAASLACGAVAAVKTSTVQLPGDLAITAVFTANVDGDGRDDLVVVAAGPDGRALRLHRRRQGDVLFASEPDHVVELPANVTGCAIGDVHPRPGSEVVLVAPDVVVAVWIDPKVGERRGDRLFGTEFLWQLPHPRRAVVWQDRILDLDGDARDDLLLPCPDGYHAALSAGDGFRDFDLRLPETPPVDVLNLEEDRATVERSEEDVELLFQLDDDRGRSALLRIDDSVPSPHAADWDADGDLDVVVQTRRKLLVWVQEPRGAFATSPTHAFDLPVQLDWPELDISYRSHLADLDGDGRVDYVLVATDPHAEKTRAQVLPYLQRPDKASVFETRGRPLLPSGFILDSRLEDVDGDGRPDLVLLAFRPEGLGAELGIGNRNTLVEMELFVYRNERGSFASSPTLRHPVRIEPDGPDLTARFLVDVTGDSVRDLLLRDTAGRVRMLPIQRDRRGALSVGEREIWSRAIDPEASVEPIDGGNGHGEILVVDRTRVTHVRFR
jgi:hypothetical protein